MVGYSPSEVTRAHNRLFRPIPTSAVAMWECGEINLARMLNERRRERSATEALAEFNQYVAMAEQGEELMAIITMKTLVEVEG